MRASTSDDHGWGPLAAAAYGGRLAVVRALLEGGEDPNRREGGVPVLALAANMGRARVVTQLIAAGADVHARDASGSGSGWTALHFAVAPDASTPVGHRRVVQLLLRAGADPNARDEGGRTPLMFVRDGDWPVMEALVRAGADVNARDDGGWTPLMFAAQRESAANINNLIYHGADVSARDADGRNVLAHLGRYHHRMLVALHALLAGKIERTPEDRAALVARAQERCREFIEALERSVGPL